MAAGAGPPSESPVVAHVTDPHFGRHDPAAIIGLSSALKEIRPDLVVMGGDVTQRARRAQFKTARAFLDDLGLPWLAIPGNHDVPLYDLFRRVFSPLGHFHATIADDRAPLFIAPGLRVLGLDSTRRKVTGKLTPDRIAQIERLAGGEPDALRVLVTHHPLVRRPLEGAAAVLEAAERAGVDVLLAGHHHRIHVTPVGRMLAVEGPSTSHLLEPVKGFFVLRGAKPELWRFDGGRMAKAALPD